eukprot:GHVU01159289.1.p2 GENE.GHVU01159289.1~~GHVU01159289.1.p2  ORF type:complete len:157 (+),score=20.61 GHVU01159289.1:707-1177(+)
MANNRPKYTNAERKKFDNKNPQRINREEPTNIGLDLDIFEIFGDIGKTFIERYKPILENSRIAGTTDSLAFNLLIRTLEDWEKMDDKVRKSGRIMPIRNEEGEVIDTKEATWSIIERKLFKDAMATLREFGLTPISRGSIKAIANKNEEKKILTLG